MNISLTIREYVVGQNLSGTIHIDAAVSPPPDTGVVFYIGSSTSFNDVTAPYSIAFDTKTVPDGTYVIKASARKKNQVAEDSITVTIKNAQPAAASKIVLSGDTSDLGVGVSRVFSAAIEDPSSNIIVSGTDSTKSVTFSKVSGTGSVTGLGSFAAIAGVAKATLVGATGGTYVLKANATLSGPGSTDSNQLSLNVVSSGGGQKNWPASFLTGPLGANNLLPTGPGIFLASMFGGSGYGWDYVKSQVLSRRTAMNRNYDIVQGHIGGDTQYDPAPQFWPSDSYGPGAYGAISPFSYTPTQEAFAVQVGSEFMVAWTPNYTVAQINSGAADAIWTKMANYWKTLNMKIIVRAFHEFDLPTSKYGVRSDWGQTDSSYSVTPANFISAWRRMVSVIHDAGATNVGFMWCPTEGAIDRSKLATYYPGDAYVDWVGTDWYNVSKVGDVNSFSTPLHSGWAEWQELFHYDALGASIWSAYSVYGDGSAVSGQKGITLPVGLPTQKPFFVGECNTIYDPTTLTTQPKKGQWYKNVVSLAHGIKDMPYLIGVSFYDVDVSSVGDNNYFVNYPTTDPSCLNGFVTMAKDPAFQGRP